MTTESFKGVKLALLSGDRLITILRDDRPDIPFPAYWDFPGGGRDGDETPVETALRETGEELGLTLSPEVICWRREFEAAQHGQERSWFMVAEFESFDPGAIRLGSEGQCWRQMSIGGFLRLKRAIPYLQERLLIYLTETKRAY